ncbi:cytochrome C biogenesis protein CcdA [Cnuibacter physcomitrellae]|uniref:Cytochrome C biogenesis protein n=1 Tax=Cnuibacter physcomitrellae TaxID=1619308 RepID=A0A1X9LR00_9MICO|nr:cytochrome c biogenesis protein CcdA [Cnuibacter physcomitrellae]ARJ07613.1 cytochrome C biogenesis protein [Cnuibacter physcomitrellae]GGI42786.1 cytochrome C biogenesis protein CcdA [Cnuibacter physcomitrellae]
MIPDLVFSGQLAIALPLAMLAGLVSFISPCVLPLVPGYLGYVSGSAGADPRRGRSRVLAGAALFVLGFAAVFIAYGALFGAVGAWLIQWQSVLIRVLGVIVIVMGVAFIGFIPGLQRTVRTRITPAVGLAGAPLLGVVFGLGWTPCFGPTLVAISALSMDSGSAGRGALLALAYCLGLGVPFLLLAGGVTWATRAVARARAWVRPMNIAGGIMLIILGLLMVTGLWTAVIYQLQGWIGAFTTPI